MPLLSRPKYYTIPESALKPHRWYLGAGRGGLIPALWTGTYFVTVGFSWGQFAVDEYKYGDSGFSPYKEIENVESIT